MNDTTKPSEYLGYWGEKYKNDLLTDILPFWLKYGIDHENGGYFTCLDRDGSLLDTNKSVWFQGRFAFILAYAYNNLEKQAEWLEACKNGIDFIEKYCFDTDGRMFYEVTKTGTPVRKRRYVFSETFAAIAMAQYIIRKTKCFDFWERNVLFPKTKRSFFRTPTPLPCPFPLNFSLLIITKKFGNLAKNRYICIV